MIILNINSKYLLYTLIRSKKLYLVQGDNEMASFDKEKHPNVSMIKVCMILKRLF